MSLNYSDLQQRLLSWYTENQRDLPWRRTVDPYHIWVSEVMLQQTRVITAIPYFLRFIEKYPAIEDLAAAGIQDVLKNWEGLGYYARARHFHQAAQIVTKQHHGEVPDHYRAFRSLPGVGNYIAAAVLSIAFGLPLAVVDGNVKRVLSRLLMIDAPVNKPAVHPLFQEAADRLLDPCRPGDFNQALMEFGAVICRPGNPECEGCFLNHACKAFLSSRACEYPVRIPGKPVPEHRMVSGVIHKKGLILISRRPPEGLLGGLWEFPTSRLTEKECPTEACERQIKSVLNLNVRATDHIATVKHTFTHFKLTMDVYHCDYISGRVRLNGPEDFKWIRLPEIDRLPFSAVQLKTVSVLRNRFDDALLC